MDKKWCLPTFFASLIIFFVLFNFRSFRGSSFKSLPEHETYYFSNGSIEHIVDVLSTPRLAYLISGTCGDGTHIQRTLQALYHPRNYYVLHLDLKTSPRERNEIAQYVHNDPLFQKFENVIFIGNANLVTYRGPTMVATTLHGAAILLKHFKDWDWFINLSTSDYPLVTQDDILYTFSNLPRDLNFIEHTSNLGWKLAGRAKPIMIDPALYLNMDFGNIIETDYVRQIPTTYKLFTGSAWMVLSRSFIEYTIMGWDNLPRILLMYYTNFVSSPEHYFHTLVCNTQEFQNTLVNHDLHYIAWDTPPKQHPLSLTLKDFQNMTQSGAPFARKFDEDDPILTLIDKELLGRASGKVTPGGWCIGGGMDPCVVIGNISHVKPGPSAQRLQGLIEGLIAKPKFHSEQCVIVS